MRMWPYKLLKYLPKKQLQSQWRECLAIKGAIEKKGTPNHLLVNKVLKYNIKHFKTYSHMVYIEGKRREIKFSKVKYNEIIDWKNDSFAKYGIDNLYIEWHNKRYMIQCYYNLQEKYDCGGISKEEWIRFEDGFNKVLGECE